MIKSFKVQLKPNKEQKKLLFQYAGLSRWAYNHTLAREKDYYEETGKFLKDGNVRKEITQLKKTEEYSWLKLYSAETVKQAVKDCCNAYKRFFKGLAERPKFKSRRKSKPSFYSRYDKLKVSRNTVTMEKLGTVKLKEKNRIPFGEGIKYSNPRVSYNGLTWYISVGVDVGDLTLNKPQTEPIGVDLGVKDLAIVSDGQKFKNINKSIRMRKLNKKLKRLQRKASKHYENLKRKGAENRYKSKNLFKLENLIRKTYKGITDIRTDYLHQITTTLVKAKPVYIVLEDLATSNMMKNKHLSRAIAEQCFYEFKRQVEYKCSWYGVELILADRFYPSSKLCSCCGYIHKGLKLSDRIYVCPKCNNKIDRDYQASINLREYPNKSVV